MNRCLRLSAIVAVWATASWSVAQTPARSEGNQAAEQPPASPSESAETTQQNTNSEQNTSERDKYIDPAAKSDSHESPIYGLMLKKGEQGEPVVADVKFGSVPWGAGFRRGDILKSFGKAKDLSYEPFLEAVDTVLAEAYDSDKIAITLMRDEEPVRTSINGFKKSPEDRRELADKAESLKEEQMKESADDRQQAMQGGEQEPPTNEELDELAQLYEQSMSGDLSDADQRRLSQLESSTLLPRARGGGWGTGAIYDAGALSNNGNNRRNANQTNRTAGTTGQQSLGGRFMQLQTELSSLQEQAANGTLNDRQTQRLNSLQRLSQAAGSRLRQSASAAGLNPQMQAQYQQLQSASQQGNLNSTQRRQLNRFQQMDRMARSGRNSNNNLINGGRNARNGNQNLTPQQTRAARQRQNNSPSTAGGSRVGNTGGSGTGTGSGIGTGGSGAGVGTGGSGSGGSGGGGNSPQ